MCKYVLYYCHWVSTQLQLSTLPYHTLKLSKWPILELWPQMNLKDKNKTVSVFGHLCVLGSVELNSIYQITVP